MASEWPPPSPCAKAQSPVSGTVPQGQNLSTVKPGEWKSCPWSRAFEGNPGPSPCPSLPVLPSCCEPSRCPLPPTPTMMYYATQVQKQQGHMTRACTPRSAHTVCMWHAVHTAARPVKHYASRSMKHVCVGGMRALNHVMQETEH